MQGEQQGPDVSGSQESYKPTIKDTLKAESQMNPEQRAQSDVRQIFIESEHRILDLADDVAYKLEGGGWGGPDREFISGTFDGRKLELSHGGNSGRCTGTADGQKITVEEAETIWAKIYPVVKTFNDSSKAEKAAKEGVQEEIAKGKVRPEDIGPYEQHQYKIKDKELAHEVALKEKQKMDETRQLLDGKIAQMELEGADKEFIDRIKEEVIKLYVLEFRSNKTFLGDEKLEGYIPELPRFREYVLNEHHEYVRESLGEAFDEYKRQKELIISLLGADEEKAQQWVRGFGPGVHDSSVYPTLFPDIILRETTNPVAQYGSQAGRQLHIERNSNYQKSAGK